MKWAALTLALLLPVPAGAYVRTTTKSGAECPGDKEIPLFWYAVTIPYVIDSAGSADITDDSEMAAIRTSFQTWQDVPGAYVAFRDDGVQDNAPVGHVQNGPNLRVVKFLENQWDYSRQALAVTLTTFDCGTGQILDADIVLNGRDFTFTTDPHLGTPRVDVQNTVTHEIGHLVGFDHTTDRESTMYAEAPAGEIKKRDLTADDALGLSTVYPVGQEPKLGACAQDASCLLPRGGGCGAAPGGSADAAAWLLVLSVLGAWTWRRRRAER